MRWLSQGICPSENAAYLATAAFQLDLGLDVVACKQLANVFPGSN